MCELKSVSFKKVTKWLQKPVVKKISMLGGTSHFYIKYENEASILIIGKEAQHFYLSAEFWKVVIQRMNSLEPEQRIMPSLYTESTTDWQCPNRNYAPNVPAICKAYLEEKETNKKQK